MVAREAGDHRPIVTDGPRSAPSFRPVAAAEASAPSPAEYVYGVTQWEPVLNYAGNPEFVEKYKLEFKREPSYFAAAGYFGCLIYAESVKRAGSLDADKVREQLLKLELRTPFGDYKVDQDGLQVAHKIVTFQWQRGKKVIVWPDEVAQGKALFPTPPWMSR